MVQDSVMKSAAWLMSRLPSEPSEMSSWSNQTWCELLIVTASAPAEQSLELTAAASVQL